MSIHSRNWRDCVNGVSAVALALGLFTLLLAVELREVMLRLNDASLIGVYAKRWLVFLLPTTSMLAVYALGANALSVFICVKGHVTKWLIAMIAQIWMIFLAIFLGLMLSSAMTLVTYQNSYQQTEPSQAELEIMATIGVVIALATLLLDGWIVELCFEFAYPSRKEPTRVDNAPASHTPD